MGLELLLVLVLTLDFMYLGPDCNHLYFCLSSSLRCEPAREREREDARASELRNAEKMETDCEMTSKEEEEESRKGIVVVLVGAPGSGKSTFCNDVMRTARRPWCRICQDTIANGKAGTRAQCVKRATDTLKDGKSVLIDRCNLEREQRVDFLKLGSVEVEVHAVVLDLPARLCISRSVARTGHEGNLQGGKSAAVVNRMLQKKELPKLNEGFSRITFCQNESDVGDAVKTYTTLGPLDTLPPGCYGQKNSDSKIQLGIMKFLKKVEGPDNVGLKMNSFQDPVHKQETERNYLSCEKHNEVASSVGNMYKEVEEDGPGELKKDSSSSSISLSDTPTLAFPSISTSDFQFDLDKASDIIVEKVEEFLNKVGNARLVLVDLTPRSRILSLVKVKAAQKSIDSNKFFTFVGDITQLYTKGGLRCNVIANAANWRLKPGGGGVNAAIFSAAGQDLEIATKERAGSLSPGSALAVPLPNTSPLYEKEGVTHVIHVLGPNMNRQRPNYLNNDYNNGCKVLREAYSSLFEGFASILRTYTTVEKIYDQKMQSGYSELNKNVVERSRADHLPDNSQKSKREGAYESERNKKCKGLQDEVQQQHIVSESSEKDNLPASTSATEVKPRRKRDDIDGGTIKGWGSWAQALYHIAMHPEKHKNDVIEVTHDVVVLNDLYSKAKRHILVVARKDGLDRLSDVREEHLQLLRTMHSIGVKWAEKFISDEASLVFRLGYHSDPSMRQLHLHVISQDFNSVHLKNKKHWNSFNTAFFHDSIDVIEEIDGYGKAKLNDDEGLLSTELRCHRCRSAHPNIPRLKAHINKCRSPFPATLLQNNHLVSAQSEA